MVTLTEEVYKYLHFQAFCGHTHRGSVQIFAFSSFLWSHSQRKCTNICIFKLFVVTLTEEVYKYLRFQAFSGHTHRGSVQIFAFSSFLWSHSQRKCTNICIFRFVVVRIRKCHIGNVRTFAFSGFLWSFCWCLLNSSTFYIHISNMSLWGCGSVLTFTRL